MRYITPNWTKHYIYTNKDGFYKRETKDYYKIIMFVGKYLKIIGYMFGVKTYSNYIWLIRSNLTHD